MFITILLPAMGLVWMVFTFTKWVKDIKTGLIERKLKGISALWESKWGHDFLISVLFVALGMSLMGVTGMVIGLMASVMASAGLWIMAAGRKVINKEV